MTHQEAIILLEKLTHDLYRLHRPNTIAAVLKAIESLKREQVLGIGE